MHSTATVPLEEVAGGSERSHPALSRPLARDKRLRVWEQGSMGLKLGPKDPEGADAA